MFFWFWRNFTWTIFCTGLKKKFIKSLLFTILSHSLNENSTWQYCCVKKNLSNFSIKWWTKRIFWKWLTCTCKIWPQHTEGFNGILVCFFREEHTVRFSRIWIRFVFFQRIAQLQPWCQGAFSAACFSLIFLPFRTGHYSFIKNFFQIILGQCRHFNNIITTPSLWLIS